MSTETRDANVLRVSHSQLLRWYTCKAAWKFNYKDKYVLDLPSPALRAGTFCHELLAKYYEAVRDGKSDIWDAMVADAKQNIPNDLNEMLIYKRVLRVVQRYIAQYAPKHDRFRILDVERHFTTRLHTPKGRPFDLEGYIDLLVEMDGKIWLWDHKSTSLRFWTKDQLIMDAQMPIYAMAMRQEGYNIFGIVINQINTYDYKDFDSVPNEKLFSRDRTYRTDKELDSILVEVGKTVDNIYEEEHYAKSLRKECSHCPYQEPCLMELKGLDPEPLWETMYKNYDRTPTTEADSDSELLNW